MTENNPDSPQAELEWQWWCWHWQNRHCARTPSRFGAEAIFASELVSVALDKIASGEQAAEFRALLSSLRRRAEGRETMGERIQRAKSYPVVKLAEELSRSRIRFSKIPCPAHVDKTPSLHIYESDNGWHCFACNKGGDTIDLMRLFTGCAMAEAVKRLS